MQITRYPSLNDDQFGGCVSAFADSLFGELNATALYLRKLAEQSKGSAFAYEMELDNHRYRALIVLDRWAHVVRAFGPERAPETPVRVQAAENLLDRVNQLIDAADVYSGDILDAAVLAFQSLELTFAGERKAAAQSAALGPMLSDDYRQARRIFLEDLAAR